MQLMHLLFMLLHLCFLCFVDHCLSFCPFLFTIVLSVLLFAVSDCLFGSFKLLLQLKANSWYGNFTVVDLCDRIYWVLHAPQFLLIKWWQIYLVTNVRWVSELFNTIFQLYTMYLGENKLIFNEMMMRSALY